MSWNPVTLYKRYRLEAERKREVAAQLEAECQRLWAERAEQAAAQRGVERQQREAERARQADLRAEQRKREQYWESLDGIQFEQELGKLFRAQGYDGARPCVDEGILQRGIASAAEWGASVAGVPVKDTIKRVSADLLIEETPERARLWQAQTPQVFRYDLLLQAHQACEGDFTDDAAMVESIGHDVRMFEGTYENIKVTTAGDLVVAEAFLRDMQGVRSTSAPSK